MTVVCTGRSVVDSGIARAVTERGGRGIAVPCDHADDEQTAAVFDRIDRDCGRLDALVNNAFAIPSEPIWGTPFWELPIALWDRMHTVGLRNHYVASVCAAKRMVPAGSGLIANISSYAGGGYQLNTAYGVGKAAVDRLARDMAHELRPHGVTAVSLWPGIVRTEWVLELDDPPFPTHVTESPEFTGRAVAALAADADVQRHSGRRLIVAELAELYGFDDIDGTRPPSLRSPRA